MKKLGKLLLAASLMTGSLLFAPPKASAFDWCVACFNNATCYNCCRCAGNSSFDCILACPN